MEIKSLEEAILSEDQIKPIFKVDVLLSEDRQSILFDPKPDTFIVFIFKKKIIINYICFRII